MIKGLRFSLLTSVATAAMLAVPALSWALPLSPGDRIRISVPADDAIPETYRFSGIYEVNLDGTLQVPFLEPMPAAGLEVAQVQEQLTDSLVSGGLFQPQFLQVTAQVVDWGPVQVTVAGATFEPGRILVTDQTPSEAAPRDVVVEETQTEPFTISGEYPVGRYLTSVLRRAGGLTPKADIENVRLIRGDEEIVVDLSGVLSGEPVEDIALIAGDQIVVPELTQIQPELVRPSQVTPSAIAIFLSNQTTPGGSGGNGEVTQVAYGSRFSQAVVAAQCAGGTRSTNANRRVTLIQTNRSTGQTEVFDRKVEDLLRNSNDTEINPYLMPEDSIVCYDSAVTNTTGVLDFIGNILNPFRTLRSIFFD
ncbi:polysaccharide export protein [Oculatella sp. FACHB-28]|uniref:polysaccharide biosynthesis/export family protein n=1 Tax=Cyanophyceae TaxID=3028117 RepID=UPI00168207EA|nr:MULTISPECIES: polysaccharide biosynthesis/export family protein [Cyanophyceae]MBD1866393.1 polysaccharide export protein [Cyanobacteria bacterium FACHB-471]MBD1998496.1 polysaccharide export protein [Leptolyngbya sp. FACHB-541]MBD2059599.1 polysaccharide export protein [Oculatella sp. FACHB-28]MBD2071371.1 polysaccharide export protein [Leptolyngbya sp. FACHB-671]